MVRWASRACRRCSPGSRTAASRAWSAWLALTTAAVFNRRSTWALTAAARKHHVILGIFRFGTSRVGEFLEKGFPFMSLGNDLHHILTQSSSYVKDVETVSKEKGRSWTRRATALM